MKRQLLTKIMLLLCALVAGSTSVWGNDVTFSYADYKGQGTSGSGSEYAMVKTDLSIKETKFNCGSSATYAQLYAGGTLTITPASGVTITQMVLTATSASYNGYQDNGTVTASTGSCSANSSTVTWNGSATAAFTIAHSKQIRWTSIVVTYTGGTTPTCAAPTFSIAAGAVLSGTTISLSTATNGAKIYYTMGANPADPTTSSTEYSDPISITEATTIKAIAAKDGNNNSTVASAAYTILAAPTPNATAVNSNYYTLVTDASSLADGDAILIVSGTKALGTTQNTNNRAAADVAIANNTINNPGASVQKLVLVKSGNYYFFYTGTDGYLYAASSSSNNLKTEADADMNAAATISINASNEATITFQGANTRNYMRCNSTLFSCYASGSSTGTAVQIYKEVVKPANAKSAAEFSFTNSVYYIAKDIDSFTAPTVSTAAGYDGTVTYNSSNTSVATVNASTGAVSIVGAGTTVISASADATENFYEDETSYTLNVYEVEDGVFDFAKGNYGTELLPGDTYITEDKTWTAGNITLKTTGRYRWYNSVSGTDLRLYSNTPNPTMVVSAPDGYVITKIDGVKSNMTASTGTITSTTWNGMSQSVTFTFEAASGSVTINSLTVYYSEPIYNITMGEAGYMTYCNKNAAISFGEGLEAYVVSASGDDNITLTPISKAPAGTPIILKGAKGSKTLTIEASADAVETNLLRVSTGSTTTTDSKIIYCLAKKADVVGFYKVKKDVIVPAGKCYIAVDVPSGDAPEFLGFNFGETTAIRGIEGGEMRMETGVFNLNGQRVAQPSNACHTSTFRLKKGLYIVNGRKVVIK